MRKTVRLNSKLYYDLFSVGNSTTGITGDKLIAVYSILKSSRSGKTKFQAFTTANNKRVSGYALLRSQTNLSLAVIYKYIPVLISIGLCRFDSNGDFILLGNQKTKELYNCYKLVPITIGNKVNDTALFAMAVRIDAAQKNQERQIRKKRDLRVQLFKGKDPKNLVSYKKAMRIEKKYGSEINITDKPVLSNKGFALIKDQTKDNSSKGHYWKKKLSGLGIITTENRFTIVKSASREEYLRYKKDSSYNPTIKYLSGCIMIQQVSSFVHNREHKLLPLNS